MHTCISMLHVWDACIDCVHACITARVVHCPAVDATRNTDKLPGKAHSSCFARVHTAICISGLRRCSVCAPLTHKCCLYAAVLRCDTHASSLLYCELQSTQVRSLHRLTVLQRAMICIATSVTPHSVVCLVVHRLRRAADPVHPSSTTSFNSEFATT